MLKFLSVLLLTCSSLFGAISLDGTIQGPGASGCGATSNCPTWSQTFASNATHAVVFITTFNTPGTSVAAVTIGGVLTCTTATANDGTHYATSWLMICPLTYTGTQTVAVSLNTTPAGGWIAQVQSVIGGATTGGYITGSASTSIVAGSTHTVTTTTTTSDAGGWAFSAWTSASTATSIAVGSGETQLGSAITGIGADFSLASYKPNNAAGTVTQTTTWAGTVSGYVAQAMLVLKPAPTATGKVKHKVIG